MTRQLDSTGLKRLHRTWRRRTEGRVALVLDRLQSPFNVGAIMRTAAAFTVEHVWLVEGGAPPDTAKAGKTALGSERYVDWTWCATVEEAAAAARAAGHRVVGLELADGAVPLHELAPAPATCVVVGHEDRGLGPAALAACDAVAFIPQLGRIGSLNVATATAIALYDLRRQLWQVEPAPADHQRGNRGPDGRF